MGAGSRWSVNLGRIAGIRIRMHLSFLLLVWLVVAAGGGRTAAAVAGELGWIAAVFACVVLHELAHSVVARRFGVVVRDILLLPIGGISEMESLPAEPGRELAIAAAGPAASVLLAVGAAATGVAAGGRLWPPTLMAGSPLVRLAWLNALLAGFNMLPALPLDGGRVLRAGLAFRMGRPRATEVAARLGQAAGIGLVVVGVGVDLWLAFIGAFVYLGATAEGREEQLRRGLAGMLVRDAMVASPWTVNEAEPISPVTALEACRRQGALPVVSSSDSYLGLIGPKQASGIGLGEMAGQVADRGAPAVEPTDRLDSALDVLRRSGQAALAVVRTDRVVVGVLRGADMIQVAGRRVEPGLVRRHPEAA